MSGTQNLLLDYVRNGSERAFQELVASYLSFVFSTAIRVVGGDKQMAEDVTQTVFVDLARKAVTLPSEVKLGGWLHRHTCFVARKALRRERRRIARERLAMQFNEVEDYTEENLACLNVVLDEVINDLDNKDRSAIILRFFEQLDFRALGEAIGSTEDAARMRVSRALAKMAALLRRRGIGLSVVGLSFVLGAKTATAAPPLLIARVTRVALVQSAKGPGILALLKYACCTRLNMGILSCAALLLILLILIIPVRETEAKLGLPTEQATPADFADLAPAPEEPVAVERSKPTTDIASIPPRRVEEPLVSPKSVPIIQPAIPVRKAPEPLLAPKNANADSTMTALLQPSPTLQAAANRQPPWSASPLLGVLPTVARPALPPVVSAAPAYNVTTQQVLSWRPDPRPWTPVTAALQPSFQTPSVVNQVVQPAVVQPFRAAQMVANAPASRSMPSVQSVRQRQP